MRTYIVNLTDNLIGEHRLEEMFYGSSTSESFLKTIDPLIFHSVQYWSPETLGKVIASVEQLECPTLDIELGTDMIRYLRILAARLLARSILYRLEVACGESHGKIPAYRLRSEWPRLP